MTQLIVVESIKIVIFFTSAYFLTVMAQKKSYKEGYETGLKDGYIKGKLEFQTTGSTYDSWIENLIVEMR